MVRPKKRYGQHFLRDENIARKIIDCLPPEYTNIVEIGSGTGVLSKYLLENPALTTWFFEIDNESADFLRETYPGMKEKLINADFLRYDLSGIPAPFVIIGNFPYNISSQILFRVLENRERVPEVIGMFQKEVAERIASPPGSRKYGILSVLMKTYYDIEYLFTVNETVFYPPPKVKSAVIRLKRNAVAAIDCDEEQFFSVVKTAFNQRRKTLRNALRSFSFLESKDPDRLESLLANRAEQLPVSDFIFLTKAIAS
jgi:16S rRNA (adenine1518-N6/adenine1519-N6)-dimethyltransferase